MIMEKGRFYISGIHEKPWVVDHKPLFNTKLTMQEMCDEPEKLNVFSKKAYDFFGSKFGKFGFRPNSSCKISGDEEKRNITVMELVCEGKEQESIHITGQFLKEDKSGIATDENASHMYISYELSKEHTAELAKVLNSYEFRKEMKIAFYKPFELKEFLDSYVKKPADLSVDDKKRSSLENKR